MKPKPKPKTDPKPKPKADRKVIIEYSSEESLDEDQPQQARDYDMPKWVKKVIHLTLYTSPRHVTTTEAFTAFFINPGLTKALRKAFEKCGWTTDQIQELMTNFQHKYRKKVPLPKIYADEDSSDSEGLELQDGTWVGRKTPGSGGGKPGQEPSTGGGGNGSGPTSGTSGGSSSSAGHQFARRTLCSRPCPPFGQNGTTIAVNKKKHKKDCNVDVQKEIKIINYHYSSAGGSGSVGGGSTGGGAGGSGGAGGRQPGKHGRDDDDDDDNDDPNKRWKTDPKPKPPHFNITRKEPQKLWPTVCQTRSEAGSYLSSH